MYVGWRIFTLHVLHILQRIRKACLFFDGDELVSHTWSHTDLHQKPAAAGKLPVDRLRKPLSHQRIRQRSGDRRFNHLIRGIIQNIIRRKLMIFAHPAFPDKSCLHPAGGERFLAKLRIDPGNKLRSFRIGFIIPFLDIIHIRKDLVKSCRIQRTCDDRVPFGILGQIPLTGRRWKTAARRHRPRSSSDSRSPQTGS